MATSARTTSMAPPNRQMSRFRARRGRRLAQMIGAIAKKEGRRIRILDLGGTRDYWGNVDLTHVDNINLLNKKEHELASMHNYAKSHVKFQSIVGDATDLKNFKCKTVDLVHSNSVMEHVGVWSQILRFAEEAKRVGKAGWIQTPAFEFPLDLHSRLLFLHWFAQPIRAQTLGWFREHANKDLSRRRSWVDYNTHLSYSEMRYLFPEQSIFIERFMFLPKSYVVYWNDKEEIRSDGRHSTE